MAAAVMAAKPRWEAVKRHAIDDDALFQGQPAKRVRVAVESVLGQIRGAREEALKSPSAPDALPIKTIDISPFMTEGAEDEDAKRRVTAQIRESWESLGFMTLTGHGIDETLLRNLEESTLRFLNGWTTKEKLKLNEQWPDELKKMDPMQAAVFRGYSPFNVENTALFQGKRGIAPDRCEKITFGPEMPEGYVAPVEFEDEDSERYFKAAIGPNIFPENEPEFEKNMRAYMRGIQRVAAAVMRACALAVDLEEDFFTSRISPGAFVTGSQRVIHYPMARPDPDMALSAHTDGGLLTLLWRPGDLGIETGGLEIYHEGSWKRAPQPTYDALTVNIADLMSWWSNGRFKSTPHRVAPVRDAEGNSPERVSFPFFLTPTQDMTVVPLKELVSKDEAEKTDGGEDPPVSARYSKWFEIRSAHLAGLDFNLEASVPAASRPDIYHVNSN